MQLLYCSFPGADVSRCGDDRLKDEKIRKQRDNTRDKKPAILSNRPPTPPHPILPFPPSDKKFEDNKVTYLATPFPPQKHPYIHS